MSILVSYPAYCPPITTSSQGRAVYFLATHYPKVRYILLFSSVDVSYFVSCLCPPPTAVVGVLHQHLLWGRAYFISTLSGARPTTIHSPTSLVGEEHQQGRPYKSMCVITHEPS